MRDALKAIAILEVGTMMPGKFAGFLLVGWGASSLRIERANAAGPISDEDLTLNRGKRSIALNLRAPEGLDILMRLAPPGQTSSWRATVPVSPPGSALMRRLYVSSIQASSILLLAVGLRSVRPRQPAPGLRSQYPGRNWLQ